jgi:hypothetical protein
VAQRANVELTFVEKASPQQHSLIERVNSTMRDLVPRRGLRERLRGARRHHCPGDLDNYQRSQRALGMSSPLAFAAEQNTAAE